MTLKQAILKAEIDGEIVDIAPITTTAGVYLADEKTTLAEGLKHIDETTMNLENQLSKKLGTEDFLSNTEIEELLGGE